MKSTILALTLSATPALACDSLQIHVTSYHTDRDLILDVNEKNPGLGCRVDNYIGSAFDWEFGGYLNSYGRPTLYNLFDLTNDAGFGVYAGLASGYSEIHTMEIGTVIAGLVYQGDYFTLRATPSYSARTDTWGAVVGVSLTIK